MGKEGGAWQEAPADGSTCPILQSIPTELRREKQNREEKNEVNKHHGEQGGRGAMEVRAVE